MKATCTSNPTLVAQKPTEGEEEEGREGEEGVKGRGKEGEGGVKLK